MTNSGYRGFLYWGVAAMLNKEDSDRHNVYL